MGAQGGKHGQRRWSGPGAGAAALAVHFRSDGSADGGGQVLPVPVLPMDGPGVDGAKSAPEIGAPAPGVPLLIVAEDLVRAGRNL